MARYEAIESRCWKNSVTGQTAGLFGAHPSTSKEDDKNWAVVSRGWTVRNLDNGTTGIGRVPWETKEEAETWIEQYNKRCGA